MYNDTIAAISTAPGEGAIGIVRLSGPDSLTILQKLFVRAARTADGCGFNPESHHLYYGRIVDPESKHEVDEVMIAYMASPNSYTREPMVEIYGHGGPVPLQEILRLVLTAGARLANPGEFTLRAFLNGRLDLSEAEAVIDIIRAQTPAALTASANQLAGSLSSRVRAVRQQILLVLAGLEAAIDFPEDEIPDTNPALMIETAVDALAQIAATAEAGIIYRQGVRTAIAGRPNVGKSSLLNALLRFERAIVTNVPGTTRDTVEETANIEGVPFVLIDTAGITQTADTVEKLGVERSRAAIEEAGLIILVLDGSEPLSPRDQEVAAAVLQARQRHLERTGKATPVITVLNKCDLPGALARESAAQLVPGSAIVRTSAVGRDGLGALERAMREAAFSGKVIPADEVLVTNPRHEQLLIASLASLRAACGAVELGMPPEIIAVDIREAVDSLGQITGETASESLLDEIFANFCIGK
jgi:tRNA modification GTPase